MSMLCCHHQGAFMRCGLAYLLPLSFILVVMGFPTVSTRLLLRSSAFIRPSSLGRRAAVLCCSSSFFSATAQSTRTTTEQHRKTGTTSKYLKYSKTNRIYEHPTMSFICRTCHDRSSRHVYYTPRPCLWCYYRWSLACRTWHRCPRPVFHH